MSDLKYLMRYKSIKLLFDEALCNLHCIFLLKELGDDVNLFIGIPLRFEYDLVKKNCRHTYVTITVCTLTWNCIQNAKPELRNWFRWVSNPGPFACEANVITTTLRNPP